MNLAVLLIGGLMTAAVVAVIYIVYLTIKKLIELIRKRKERNAKQKVAFGKTSKIVEENAREIINAAPSMTMEELENLCTENPYFVVNYDSDTDEVIDYQTIKTDAVDEKVSEIVKEKGIVLFD